jgi:small subunit ribosomal protein S3
MGQKVNPTGFRLATLKNWESRWYANKQEFGRNLEEDYRIRKYLTGKFKYASIPRIFIERAGNRIRIKIFSARPGIIIGRRGKELEKIKNKLTQLIGKTILLDIQEVKKPDIVARLVAENIAVQLERRISFRRAMKKAIQTTMSLGAEGIRVQVSGRLGGADIARTEKQRAGRIPLHTLRERIDYGFCEANTVYGIIGVKCWMCIKEKDNPFEA